MTNLDKIATHPIQSSAWSEFRKNWGNEVVETDHGLITLHKLPLLPYKIGIFEKGPRPTKKMIRDLKKLGEEKRLIFVKLEPNSVKENSSTILLKTSGAVSGKTLFTPSTFWIDLTKSEEELLRSFHSKTRYNIRLAERRGVVVREDNSDKAFEKYLELTFETAKRQGFFAHTPRYHRLMWETLKKAGIAHLFTATYKGKIITTWILFVWRDFLYYPYGASSEAYKEVMANNLMMWKTIKFGKSLGLTTFDLWGREEGKGFTKFKEGYNPKVVEFLGSWDLIINKPLYHLYRVAEVVRWAILRLKTKITA